MKLSYSGMFLLKKQKKIQNNRKNDTSVNFGEK